MNDSNDSTTTVSTPILLSLREIYSADINQQYTYLFRASLLAFAAFYYTASPFYPSPKQKSWILTTLSGFLMTACSIPFVVDYLRGGFSVTSPPLSSPFAYGVNKVFQAYLVACVSSHFFLYLSSTTSIPATSLSARSTTASK